MCCTAKSNGCNVTVLVAVLFPDKTEIEMERYRGKKEERERQREVVESDLHVS